MVESIRRERGAMLQYITNLLNHDIREQPETVVEERSLAEVHVMLGFLWGEVLFPLSNLPHQAPAIVLLPSLVLAPSRHSHSSSLRSQIWPGRRSGKSCDTAAATCLLPVPPQKSEQQLKLLTVPPF